VITEEKHTNYYIVIVPLCIHTSLWVYIYTFPIQSLSISYQNKRG